MWSMVLCEWSQRCFRRLCKELHIPRQPVTAWLLESRMSGCYFSCSFVCTEVLHVCIRQQDCSPVWTGISLMYMCGRSETTPGCLSSITCQFLGILLFSFFPNFSWVLFFHCIFTVLSYLSIWIILSKVYLQFNLPWVPPQVPACFPNCTKEYLYAFSSK